MAQYCWSTFGDVTSSITIFQEVDERKVPNLLTFVNQEVIAIDS